MHSNRAKILLYFLLVTTAIGQTFTREFIRFNGSVIAVEGPIADPVPAIDSLFPSSGAGTSSTFTGTFSDQAGASSITAVQFWFDSTSADCHLAYFPSTNQIYLDSSANNSNWIGNGTPGSGGVLNNGVCSLALASSSASQSGTTLQVSASLSFAVSGVYAEKLAATNATGTNGWVSFGNWTVGGTVPGAGVYDDRDAHLVYSGSWAQASNPGLYASTESYTQVANDSLTFQFNGTQISYVYTMATNLGYFNILIDGNTVQSNVDSYLAPTGGNANYLWQKIWTYSGLTAGNHTITIVATGTKNPSATDTYIAADAFIVGTSYNDNSPSVSYGGTWTGASGVVPQAETNS